VSPKILEELSVGLIQLSAMKEMLLCLIIPLNMSGGVWGGGDCEEGLGENVFNMTNTHS